MKANALFFVLVLSTINLSNSVSLRISPQVDQASNQEPILPIPIINWPSVYLRTSYIGDRILSSNQGTISDYDFKKIIRDGQVTNGYCEKKDFNSLNYFSNHYTCGGYTQQIGTYIRINFCSVKEQTYTFRFGVDFGLGVRIYVNNIDGKKDPEYINKTDLWWEGNRNYTVDTIYFTVKIPKGGHYFMEIYGAEHCCDGMQEYMYKTEANTTWRFITLDNLKEECHELDGAPCQ